LTIQARGSICQKQTGITTILVSLLSPWYGSVITTCFFNFDWNRPKNRVL